MKRYFLRSFDYGQSKDILGFTINGIILHEVEPETVGITARVEGILFIGMRIQMFNRTAKQSGGQNR